ncbi:flagellar hook assembly protein FlgD [Methylocella tundrae]|uniref:Basal-body rod modification protein FlgD n=1 Tax=Methylocella tundrae TaxID=227605 RepID=A0A4U8YVL4_METTU|nr:flagellar hook assembly protein FlgD [Methylocella tundrae]WPP04742.1 flagellar hook assembly protein FlgD [Methylocella tundrae]VFU06946.1 Flagellar basal-body rod modification protein FlgD [Methylocella tundrae]
MSVNRINTATSTPGGASTAASSATSSSATVDYNQFLQLLVAELKNQDPTSPTDPTQYMSQLASFSSVEQQVQTNSTLDALLATQSGGLVGQTVTSADGTTSGVVASVQTSTGGGATATLQNGGTVALGFGVTIGSS